MTSIYESEVEKYCIELLQEQGYSYLSPEALGAEREKFSDVVLHTRLKNAIAKLNPTIPEDVKEQALREVLNLPSQDLVENNEAFHRLLSDGVGVEYQKKGDTRGDKVWLIDFQNSLNNDLLVCNQFTVTENKISRRPDIVLFVNGLPLVVIELKNPSDEKATVEKAFTQLQNYKAAISGLFFYNGVMVASDGHYARAGSLTAGWTRFMSWKTVDGVRETSKTTPQIETFIKGMLRPDVLLDLIKQFTVFEKTKKEDPITGLSSIEIVKKIAAYHQYHAVNKAVESTLRAIAPQTSLSFRAPPSSYGLASVEEQPKGDRKAGVLWHTQGSGKSLSMVFYAGKIVLELDNPSILVITDRNDLDGQLFDTFSASKQLLRQDPVQANDRSHLKKLLKTSGGGIIFSTIQKFSPEDSKTNFELLSERENIVVIADEAHRSQYGFAAKTLIKK